MKENEAPKPLLSGIVYGEFAFWLAIIGSIVATVGIAMYFAGNQFFDSDKLIAGLWSGKNATQIWNEAANSEVIYGHWYLQKLGTSDGISMLGVAIACLAGVFGAWGSLFGMIINKERPAIFMIFAGIIIAIVTLSAFGLISIH